MSSQKEKTPHLRIVANEAFLANPAGLDGRNVNPRKEIEQMLFSVRWPTNPPREGYGLRLF